MTGRDLIVYILNNHLEDKPIYHNGRLLGFITVEEMAEHLGVGLATARAMALMNRLDYICIGDTVLFPAMQLPTLTLERNNTDE